MGLPIMTSVNGECHGRSGPTKHALDDLFGLFATFQRRLVLHYLANRCDGVADFEDVVEFVAARTGASGGNRDTISIDLQHNHLPKLEQYGVVEYDDRSRGIRYREDKLVERWLERVESVDLE